MQQMMDAFVRTNAQTMEVELQEIAVPQIDEGEICIQVHAFGVGVHDRFFIPGNAHFPYPIGSEGAGIVEAVGNQVTDVQVGERVIFSSSMQPKGGCWAEYVVVNPETIIPMPDSMDMNIGAALPVAGKTALESLRDCDLNQGDTLFVAGASGAIGSIIIQLAQAQGVHIIGSASKENHAYMKKLGAEHTVDYQDGDWKEQVLQWAPGGVDVALAIQSGTAEDSREVVKHGGYVITVSNDKVPSEGEVGVHQFDHLLDIQTAVQRLIDHIEAGTLTIEIDQQYPFKQALDALEKTETRHARGKQVVVL